MANCTALWWGSLQMLQLPHGRGQELRAWTVSGRPPARLPHCILKLFGCFEGGDCLVLTWLHYCFAGWELRSLCEGAACNAWAEQPSTGTDTAMCIRYRMTNQKSCSTTPGCWRAPCSGHGWLWPTLTCSGSLGWGLQGATSRQLPAHPCARAALSCPFPSVRGRAPWSRCMGARSTWHRPGAQAGAERLWHGLSARHVKGSAWQPVPRGQPEMTDKACLHGNDSPALTRSVSVPQLRKFQCYPLGGEGLQNTAHPLLASGQQFLRAVCRERRACTACAGCVAGVP